MLNLEALALRRTIRQITGKDVICADSWYEMSSPQSRGGEGAPMIFISEIAYVVEPKIAWFLLIAGVLKVSNVQYFLLGKTACAMYGSYIKRNRWAGLLTWLRCSVRLFFNKRPRWWKI